MTGFEDKKKTDLESLCRKPKSKRPKKTRLKDSEKGNRNERGKREGR